MIIVTNFPRKKEKIPNEKNFEKVELWVAKIERKTLTGLPELVLLQAVQLNANADIAQIVKQKGVLCVSVKDDVYVYGRSKYAASYFSHGFTMAHAVTNLSPIPSRSLHTMN